MNTRNVSSNESTILELFTYHSKKSPLISNNFFELKNFKKELEVTKSLSHYKPFESALKKTIFYRLLFKSIGAFFFFLTIFMYDHSINWLPYSHIFTNSSAAKNVMIFIALFSTFAAFGMSFLISAEKEALYLYINRTKRKLKRIYKKKLLEREGLNQDKALKTLNLHYQEALDKTSSIQRKTKELLHLISKLKDEKKKARLYNEALLESNEELHSVINLFLKSH